MRAAETIQQPSSQYSSTMSQPLATETPPQGVGTLCYIYALHASNDPTCRPRYVGFTIRLKQRREAHNSGREKGRKGVWVRQLLAVGAHVVMTVLHEFHSDDALDRAIVEANWIEDYRDEYSDLLNDSGGGDGVAPHSKEMRAKIGAALRGKKHTPESIAKMKESGKQRYSDPSARLKVSETRKRHCAIPEVRAKMTARIRLLSSTPEFREKSRANMKKLWADPEYRKKVKNKKYYSDPQYRAKLSAAKKLACNSPEFRSKMSELNKRRLADPEARAKHKKAVGIACRKPEVRELRRELAKQLWKRPEHRAKFLATRAKRIYKKRTR